jgi:hypothetical protein
MFRRTGMARNFYEDLRGQDVPPQATTEQLPGKGAIFIERHKKLEELLWKSELTLEPARQDPPSVS